MCELPKIAIYHARLRVCDRVVEVDMDDYYSDAEAFEALREATNEHEEEDVLRAVREDRVRTTGMVFGARVLN